MDKKASDSEVASLKIEQIMYKCPVCGYRDDSWSALTVSGIKPYSGTYCMNCIAKWLYENIPQMEENNGG